ncbi:MAG: tryptophan--tRNA ligase [Gammaproteobacteria bacterium RIFCSPHIGHO2_02_FULL_42_13]|nr:MAG: tryptophan--tRNA ligase [Gammaproteobacteria bacterium RIFCSPHIGHO2_02_FULL_42_13]OGT70904.1 MAG: tryptophan--tRNA ligase [Gammaproteobacteria bacterium RIFCSPLOWO2_02_FULL_42_9]
MVSRILSGMRTTGELHLGHYHGVLKNWLELQQQYDCFFFAADWHALTTDYEDPYNIPQYTFDMIVDWLAVGIDPKRANIFIQSRVPLHAELHVLLSMITPLGWLERVPTYKDQQQQLKDKDLSTYGFLGYPVLQAADILMYKASKVPVGADQVPHVELVREIARRFNYLYGRADRTQKRSPEEYIHIILPEPEVMLTKCPIFPGLDGRKMSKTYHNTIGLREDPKSVEQKLLTMPTDPARVKRTDPGDPEKCPVWPLHKVYSDDSVKEWVQKGCRSAGIGCIECKRVLIDKVLEEQAPICERALEFEQNPAFVHSIIEKGCEAAQSVAKQTMAEVREAMGILQTGHVK